MPVLMANVSVRRMQKEELHNSCSVAHTYVFPPSRNNGNVAHNRFRCLDFTSYDTHILPAFSTSSLRMDRE